MALAKQFYSSFKSYNGWEYYLEIWVEGYSGSASEISIGAGGPIITYGTDQEDRFSPILSSKLELPFMVTNTTQDGFIKNIREQFNERDVYIHLYRENSSGYSSVAPLWSGYVLMDLSASPDLYYPYPVTLTAVDGLALLKDIDFVQSGTAGSYTDSDMYSSNGRFTYWVKEILLKTGASTTTQGSTQDYKFTTAINWFNSVMPTITQSTDPFYQTKCGTKMFFSKDANGNFTVVNTYDVLLNLLKHWGARIIYWKHVFYIVQIQEYNTAESGTYANPDNINTRTYLKTGAFDSSSDNLGDSYWTRYNLLIDDVTGGIQKLVGSEFNYLPQLKRTQANFLDYGNKNYFGGLPFDITTGQADVILQDTFEDVSSDGAMLLMLPLDITIAQQYNGSLSMRLYFRLYITDGATTYYLRYNPTNTPKFYWESSTTVNLNFNQTRWFSPLDNIVGTQTKVGFHQLIEFKDSGGSALNLSGEWEAYTDIDTWGGSGGSFYFLANVGGIGGGWTQIYEPSLTTVYWTNTLNQNYQTPLNPVVIGTTSQQTTGMTGTSYNYTTNNIVSYLSSFNINPFEGKLLIVNTSSTGAIYGSQVMVTPQTITSDVEVVDFGDLIWGDTLLASSEGSLKVWNGSAFVKSNVTGTWGLGSTSGTNSFTEMLLSEYLFGQTKVVETPSMQLVIGETNKNQNDGSGSRPNYVNPIGRLKGYSATGTTPYYIFKSGSFHLLRDEIDYEGYQIIRDTQTVTKTHDIIIGPDVLQDKTNKIGQKTPSSNTLAAKLTQNSFITTISSTKSAYGSDIAVNGIFSSDSNWTKGTGWSIASNKASFSPTGSTSEIKQDILTNALTYKIVVTVSVSAGGLSVKAGSSGSATVLSASGTYEIFSTCSGSTDVIFEASAAFEGYIEKVVVQQQVPITSININAIGTAVFKTNDVLNIANFDGNEINQFTVSSDQGSSDTSISVTSKLITEDILEGSIILVNQNDLAAQYQNKTKGTVAGFTIDADGIAKGGVEITGWLDSDTMSGATANNVPTAESVKAYVDAQVGSADTLQEVTDLGNTTTNSVNIGSATSPAKKLTVTTSATNDGILGITTDGKNFFQAINSNSTTFPVGQLDLYYGTNVNANISALSNEMRLSGGYTTGGKIVFRTASTERMRLTDTGNLLINATSSSKTLYVNGTMQSSGEAFFSHFDNISNSSRMRNDLKLWYNTDRTFGVYGNASKIAIYGNSTDMLSFDTSGNATFSGQVTIPATPVASTDAASKGYVDAQVGTADTLQEVTDLGNTSTNSITIGSSSSPTSKLEIIDTTVGTTPTDNDNLFIKLSNKSVTSAGETWGIGFNSNNVGTDKLGAFVSAFGHYSSNYNTSLIFGTRDTSGNASEKMRLTSGGNLLVNRTTDAGSRVQVDGEIRIYNANFDINSDGYGYRFGAGDCGIFHSSYNITFKNYNGSSLVENMRLTSDGNLLIGTTSDGGSKLQVTSNLNQQHLYIQGGYAEGIGALAQIKTTANGNALLVESATTSDSREIFEVKNTNGTVFKVQGDGAATFSGQVTIPATPVASTDAASKGYVDTQVGTADTLQEVTDLGNTTTNSIMIGSSSSPEQKLHVDGGNALLSHSSSHVRLYLRADNSSQSIIYFGDNDSSTQGRLAYDNNGDYMYFNTNASEKMRITSDGLLGLGTSSPAHEVQVVSAGNAEIQTQRTSGAGVLIQSQSATGVVGTNTNHNLDLKTNGSTRLRILTNGNVLIGTTTDSGEKLFVVGDVRVTGTLKVADGTAQAPSIAHRADENTGIFFPSNDNIGFTTSNTERARISDNGNLLIGTTTDSGNKLDVLGDVLVQNSSAPNFKIYRSGTGQLWNMQIDSSGRLQIKEAASLGGTQYTRLQIDDSGEVEVFNTFTGTTATFSGTVTAPNLSATTAVYSGGIVYGSTTLSLKNNTGGSFVDFNSSGNATFSGNIIVGDSNHLLIGDSSDFDLYHTGTNSFIENWTGDLYIRNNSNGNDVILQCDDGAGGVTDYMRLDGSAGYTQAYKNIRYRDNVKADFGNGGDLDIYHDGSNSYISQGTTGDLYIRQTRNDGDMFIQCDNGSGGNATYIQLDGSQTTINIYKNLLVGTTVDTGLYKIDVAGKQRVQSVLELEDVLTLNAISTPADPASGKSSIYMDSSDGAIKVKINVGGTVVTRTIASFE